MKMFHRVKLEVPESLSTRFVVVVVGIYRFEEEFGFLFARKRLPAQYYSHVVVKTGEAADVKRYQSVTELTVVVAVGVVAQFHLKRIVGVDARNEIDAVGGAAVAPGCANTQCQISVLGDGHPVADYLDRVFAVGHVVVFDRENRIFSADAVNPMDYDVFFKTMGVDSFDFAEIHQRSDLFIFKRRGRDICWAQNGLVVEVHHE